MNLFKKAIGHNLFKKISNGANNFFHKASDIVQNIPAFADRVGDKVKNVANEIQKKANQYAPIASSIATYLGAPGIGAGIMGASELLNNYNKQLQNGVTQGQQKINDLRNILAPQ